MLEWRARLSWTLATGFGLGAIPVAPGTFGTLPAVAFFAILARFTPEPYLTIVLGAALALACVANIAVSDWAIRHWKCTDPGNFVLDEVAGYLLTVLLFRGGSNLWITLLWTFALTRLFDIAKPPPVRWFERLPGGWGILCDDLAASVYAALALHALRFYWPFLFP